MDSNIEIDSSLKNQLQIDEKDLIYDRKTCVETTPKQKLNKHQQRQLREKNLKLLKKTNAQIKNQKKLEKERSKIEKYNRRSEFIEKIKQMKLEDNELQLINKSSSIGTKLTDKQKYSQAIKFREMGLPYDKSIIEKTEKKILSSKERQDKKDEIVELPVKEIVKIEKPAVIKPLMQIVKEKNEKKIIEKEENNKKKEEVKEEAKPRPAINVMLNRPEGVQEIREKLPIIGEEQYIMETIHENDVVIVCGETGSGKTTQIPQFLYEAGYGTLRTKGKIAITEPRRVAAINMAKRVSYEMGLQFGQDVGYHIRGSKCFTSSTTIKFLTDGVLLKEGENDALFSNYSVIIIDEAHERTINTDVLIGILSRMVIKRRKMFENGENVEPLKLIIMSATLRVDDFVKNERLFQKPPPLIKINARQFDVAVHFSSDTPSKEDVINRVKHTVCQIHERMGPGGILVFLPGKQDIIECVNYFKRLYSKANNTKPKRNNKEKEEEIKIKDNEEKNEEIKPNDKPEEVEDVESILEPKDGNIPLYNSPMHVLPLYSLLDQKEQDKVFQPVPEGKRLVVFSTNVAETSVTIPGIKYVVDSGLEKKRTFDFQRGIVATTVDVISKASAEQRKGRAGRTGPGHCFRLYSAAFYGNYFEEFSVPEIQRKPVDEVVLLLKTMLFADISKFPFPSLITDEALAQAEKTLIHLGAIETQAPHAVTEMGKAISQYPVEPRLGKLLVCAKQTNVLEYAIAVAAALTVREPFFGQSTEESPRGDVIRLLKLYGAYTYEKNKEQFCKERNLRIKAMEEIDTIREQLRKIIIKSNGSLLPQISRFEPFNDNQEIVICQCIFSAFCDHVARRDDKGKLYTTADGKHADLQGNSSLFKSRPLYICYTDFDNTNDRNKLLNVTKISSTWIPLIGSKVYLNQKEIGPAEYRKCDDLVVGRVEATFGNENWKLPEVYIPHPEPYRAFAAALLDGIVIQELSYFSNKLAARTEDLRTGKNLPPRLLQIYNVLRKAHISSKKSLQELWKTQPMFLLTEYLYWLPNKNDQVSLQKHWPYIETSTQQQQQDFDSDSDSDSY